MKPPRLYEPDLIASAVQATALMLALILPLALSIELKRTIIPVSLSVPIVTEARPAPLAQPAEEISELREQLRQSQTEADLARSRQQTKQREQQRERERLEAERQRQAEEEKRRAEQEQAERERAEQEAREKRRKLEQQQQQRRREEASVRSLSTEQRTSLIGRYTSGIKERVHRYMSNPEGISAADGIAVEVRVRLDSRGMLVATPEIERSSGIDAYDTQAIRAIIRAAAGGFDLPDDQELRNEFGDLLLTIKPKK